MLIYTIHSFPILVDHAPLLMNHLLFVSTLKSVSRNATMTKEYMYNSLACAVIHDIQEVLPYASFSKTDQPTRVSQHESSPTVEYPSAHV